MDFYKLEYEMIDLHFRLSDNLKICYIFIVGFLNSECYHPGSGAFCQSPDNELSFTLKITKQLASIKPLDEADLMFNI
ncbi:hypothetical protein Plhal703r1_c21g0092851 [Plasmopara halstedii]